MEPLDMRTLGERGSAPHTPLPRQVIDHFPPRESELERRLKEVLVNELDATLGDDHAQDEGVKRFKEFRRRVRALDRELHRFRNTISQLSSSVGLLSSTEDLRKRLQQLLNLFRENAADIFRDVRREFGDFSIRKPQANTCGVPTRPSRKFHSEGVMTGDLEQIPSQLHLLAQDWRTFLEALNRIPEFRDEVVSPSIRSFYHDLEYWSFSLRDFKDQFKWPSVQRHIHFLTGEMAEHLNDVTEALKIFTDVAVPKIRFSQRQEANPLRDLSTVATLFSAVTATTIQFSYLSFTTKLEKAVNLLWVTSLVFSLASAINSQMAYHWRSAMYRSPDAFVPWWVSVWIVQTPLLFLVISMIAFSTGLVCFTFANFSSTPFIPIAIAVCTSISSVALLAVGLWFAGERHAFGVSKGKKWLSEMLKEARVYHYIAIPCRWIKHALLSVIALLRRLRRRGTDSLSVDSDSVVQEIGSDIESGTSMTPYTGTSAQGSIGSRLSVVPLSHTPSLVKKVTHLDSDVQAQSQNLAPGVSNGSLQSVIDPTFPEESLQPKAKKESTNMFSSALQVRTPMPPARKGKLKEVASKVLKIKRVLSILRPSFAPLPSPTSNDLEAGLLNSDIPRNPVVRPSQMKKSRRLTAILSVITSLKPIHELPLQPATIKHLKFSPDGEYLATSSGAQTVVIWKLEDEISIHHKLIHQENRVAHVAWSPDGEYMLTRLTRCVYVWLPKDGLVFKTIDRGQTIQWVAWMPNSVEFVTVEGKLIRRLSINGNVLGKFEPSSLLPQQVVVVPDEERLLVVTTLEVTHEGRKPSKSRVQKRILLYNMRTGEIEHKVPILNDVRHLVISRSGSLVLVSYHRKADPQLFRLNVFRDDRAHLSLVHTYHTHDEMDAGGSCQLGRVRTEDEGSDWHVVVCARKGGDILFWDRETSKLLHSIPAKNPAPEFNTIAWNCGSSNRPMFATASRDRAVHIWAVPKNAGQGLELNLFPLSSPPNQQTSPLISTSIPDNGPPASTAEPGPVSYDPGLGAGSSKVHFDARTSPRSDDKILDIF